MQTLVNKENTPTDTLKVHVSRVFSLCQYLHSTTACSLVEGVSRTRFKQLAAHTLTDGITVQHYLVELESGEGEQPEGRVRP